uniref:Cytochrome-c oxidase n=1 Tax=Parastrongyloides trichosuri TaxID=131310 RepID=A0A0N4ZQC2_PARTI
MTAIKRTLIQINPINLKFCLYIVTIVLASIPGFFILGFFKNLIISINYDNMDVFLLLKAFIKNSITITIGTITVIIYCDAAVPFTMIGFEYILTKI